MTVTVIENLLNQCAGEGVDPGTLYPLMMETGLHEAAGTGREDILLRLLALGADADRNSAEGTPLQIAVHRGKPRCVRLLLQQPIDRKQETEIDPAYINEQEALETVQTLLAGGGSDSIVGLEEFPAVEEWVDRVEDWSPLQICASLGWTYE